MEDKNLYPNSFQMHNFYIDKCLHLLDGNEIKVLLYVIRRIIGWNKEFDRISLAQFEKGIISKTGERLDFGVGLSKPSIVKALNQLNKYGFLIQLEHSNNPKLGNAFTLEFDYSKIHLNALEKRELNKGKTTSKDPLLVKNIYQSNPFTSKKALLVDQPKNDQKSVDLLVKNIDTHKREEVRVREEKKEEERKEISHDSSSVCSPGQENLSPSQNIVGSKTKSVAENKPTKVSQVDPRFNHPGLLAIRNIVATAGSKEFPSKLVWDDLIAVLGDKPDIQRLGECAKAWTLKGWRIGNLAWVTEWYKNGIPLSEHKQIESKPIETKRHLTANEWRAIDAEKEKNRPVSDIDPNFDIKAALAAMKQDVVNKRSYKLVGN